MKFGKQLHDQIEDKWRDHYIDYKSIKKVIKALVGEAAAKPDSSTAVAQSFTKTLTQQLQVVNAFYKDQVRSPPRPAISGYDLVS
eukprot:SAG31_NODE_2065_length_6530_cov_22.048515_4_plen_85_part_00